MNFKSIKTWFPAWKHLSRPLLISGPCSAET
ncbi:MAG: hypothetical protein RI894_1196, partial [Bacteroidota bacterium]